MFQDKHLQELADLVAEGGHLVSQIEKTGPGNLYAISCGGGSLCGPMGQVCLHFIKMPCGDRFFKHALLVVEGGLNRQSALSAIQMNKKDMLCI